MAHKEIERFKARSDDGTYETTIVVRQELIDAADQDTPYATIGGIKTATTIDGHHCNSAGNGAFEVVGDPNLQSPVLVRRVAE